MTIHRFFSSLAQSGRAIFCAGILLIGASLMIDGVAVAQSVKQSGSGICHCPGGAYYDRTTRYTAFDSLSACIGAGGREPKSGQGMCAEASTRGVGLSSATRPSVEGVQPPANGIPAYDRGLFGGWIDADGDCHDTRAEILMALSTAAVAPRSNDRCIVSRGRWNDPYTGRVFFEASDLDIDHLVPLKWAWDRGAHGWDREARVRFANDPVNLFAVEAQANRKKGAAGPLEWLPPNTGFRCEYVTRFARVVRIYNLDIPKDEQQRMTAQRAALCGN